MTPAQTLLLIGLMLGVFIGMAIGIGLMLAAGWLDNRSARKRSQWNSLRGEPGQISGGPISRKAFDRALADADRSLAASVETNRASSRSMSREK